MSRTLTAEFMTTVEGFGAGGTEPYFGYGGPEFDAWLEADYAEPYEAVMGRATYEVMREMGDERFDALPKVVVSRSLTELEWPNARIVRDVRALKAEDGPPLRTTGSPTLVGSLLRDGLVDAVRLIVAPLLLGGSGSEPVFAHAPDVTLELRSTLVLDGQVLVLTYGVLT